MDRRLRRPSRPLDVNPEGTRARRNQRGRDELWYHRTMAGWRVAAWSVERGEGIVESDDVGPIPILRIDALVDDFVVGEEVELVLEDVRGGVVARDVAPARWRENAPPLEDVALEGELREKLALVTSALGPHARVQLRLGKEDVVHLEIQDVDWPPPVTPPLGTLEFEGVTYVKLPAFSEEFVRLTAWPWPVWAKARPKVLRYWGLARDLIPDDAILFRFEPTLFRESAGYIVAASLEVNIAPRSRR
jgi:hypothetical protein